MVPVTTSVASPGVRVYAPSVPWVKVAAGTVIGLAALLIRRRLRLVVAGLVLRFFLLLGL